MGHELIDLVFKHNNITNHLISLMFYMHRVIDKQMMAAIDVLYGATFDGEFLGDTVNNSGQGQGERLKYNGRKCPSRLKVPWQVAARLPFKSS